jgi:hypothetical protein
MKRNAEIGPLTKPSVLGAQQPVIGVVELHEALVVAALVGMQLLGLAASEDAGRSCFHAFLGLARNALCR